MKDLKDLLRNTLEYFGLDNFIDSIEDDGEVILFGDDLAVYDCGEGKVKSYYIDEKDKSGLWNDAPIPQNGDLTIIEAVKYLIVTRIGKDVQEFLDKCQEKVANRQNNQ